MKELSINVCVALLVVCCGAVATSCRGWLESGAVMVWWVMSNLYSCPPPPPRELRDSADCRISTESSSVRRIQKVPRNIAEKREKLLFDVFHSQTNLLVPFNINVHCTFWSFQFFGPGFRIILVQNFIGTTNLGGVAEILYICFMLISLAELQPNLEGFAELAQN